MWIIGAGFARSTPDILHVAELTVQLEMHGGDADAPVQ